MIQLPRLHPALVAALAFGTSAIALLAQSPSPSTSPNGPPDGPPPGHHGPPPSPLFRALDTNHDGVISAEEIANAPAVLKQLAGPSGQLTRDSLRPPHHDGEHEGPDGDRGPQDEGRHRHGPRADAQDSPNAGPDGQDHPPHRPPPPDGPRDQRKAPAAAAPSASPGTSPNAGPGPGPGPDGRHHGPPRHDPIFEALDTNHDGVITADEIEAAATSLKKADKNGDGQIDRKDFGPPPPPPGAAPQ